ncbi:MAG: hypothetical protein ACYDGM_05210 [Vulcanimicrobiaceae bacterium]
MIPHLNTFGAHFLAAGDRIPGLQPGPALPLAVKINLVDSSERQGSGENGQGLPKAIVDEVEVFTAGTIGTRASYFVEQYAVDGGMHGLLRDAWVSERLNPWNTRIPLSFLAGSFTLPLPVDPETFRETAQHYTIFDQTVGNNPFTFFAPKIGAKVSFGDTLSGLSAQVFAGPGHDRQSGLQTIGTDLMTYLQDAMGPVTLSVYRYHGRRPDTAPLVDRFSRTGYAAVINAGKWTSETLLQTGWDSSVAGTGYRSSGGFTQLRYAFSRRFFALGRYQGTSDPSGFTRDGIVLLGYGPTENARLTIEYVITHAPLMTRTMNAQFTVGY